jgi:hypothetical protein
MKPIRSFRDIIKSQLVKFPQKDGDHFRFSAMFQNKIYVNAHIDFSIYPIKFSNILGEI